MIEVDIEQQLGNFRIDVRFEAEAPIVGLFGRSGSGKTSVINAIAGITTPSQGVIRISDTVLFDAANGINLAPEKRRVGYVFQDPLLFPHLDVETNLHYGLRRRTDAERFIEPGQVVDLLGLGAFLRRMPKALSGGEKQRVAIGRALLAQPRILLMDEPLAALDVPRKTEILDYIERLRDEVRIPIVYVSHSVPEVARLADSVVVLADGKCLVTGKVDEVMGQLDFRLAPGSYEVGSMLDTRVTSHDGAHQLTTLAFDGGELTVPYLNADVGARVRARIRARDISLAVDCPTQISILNILQGYVHSIEVETGPLVDVHLAVGGSTLTARITRRSCEQLGIRAGQRLYALIKAVSFDQQSVGYA